MAECWAVDVAESFEDIRRGGGCGGGHVAHFF